MAMQPQVSKRQDRRNDRITVANAIYFRSVGEEVAHLEVRYSKELQSVEGEHYERRLKIGEQWVPLDTGFIPPENVKTLVLHNEESRYVHNRPSDAERAEIESRVVELAYVDSGLAFEIPPGECFQGNPVDAAKLCLRCQHGKAKVRIFIVPR